MRSIYLVPLVLIGCGDNIGTELPPDGRRVDSSTDGDLPDCSYTEAADATNDDLFGTGTAEATGLSFPGAFTLCGKVDNSHFVSQDMLVDIDSYAFTVPAQSSGIVYITAPGAENLDTLLLEIYGMNTGISEVGKFIGDFAIASADLPPDTYQITVSTFNGAAPAAAIDYKIVLKVDDPLTRCGKSTATATYTENLDGNSATGNDVYEVRYGMDMPPLRRFTLLPTDVVEPTGIMAAPNMSYRVTGTITDPNGPDPVSWMDRYKDRDTYQITMGADADQLSLRLNWASTTADLDVLVFPMAMLNDFAQGYYNGNMEDEFITTAVMPGMSYWVFVGADNQTTGEPITYDLTVCGATFTP